MIEELAHRWLRPTQSSPRDIRLDLAWLVGFALLLIATGIGLRDPWPADEPRFALVARDMVASGDWLIPRVGGELYPDKPPLYFWLLAAGYALTGSLRASFLLPSLLSAIGCVVLVYDLARRLWNREAGLIAATLLLLTVQFVWQARQAQIDATLCFWTTLSLYGLLRHLLLGPQWPWYVVGCAAAGFGVITKGVGFLPLLIFIPWILLNVRSRVVTWRIGTLRWLLGPLAFAAAIAFWLVPMLLVAQADPAVAAYRDEILFVQTAERYLDAWHHVEPFWYFLVEVIPVLWLPGIALVPWLLPRWRDAWRSRDSAIVLLLAWTSIVLVFFSASSGKRGVYVLPAVPAFVLACAPYVLELAQKRAVRRVVYTLTLGIAAACVVGIAYLFSRPAKHAEIVRAYGLDPIGPAALIAACILCVCALCKPRRAFLAFAGAVTTSLLVVSFWANPAMNDVRSGARFVRELERVADPDRELGLVTFREEHLLNASRPIVHFGHARWREWQAEAADAAAWLDARAGARQLMVDERAREFCFADAEAIALGSANRKIWYLVQGTADPACAARGAIEAARAYVPPGVRNVSVAGHEPHELSRHPSAVRTQSVPKHGE